MTRDELIKQAEEAFQAKRDADAAGAKVTFMERERDATIENARQRVEAAERAVTAAVDDRSAAQALAIEQLSEANAALLDYVNGPVPVDPAEATPADPAVG